MQILIYQAWNQSYSSKKLTDDANTGCPGTTLWVDMSPRTQLLKKCIMLIVWIKHIVNREGKFLLDLKVYKSEVTVS